MDARTGAADPILDVDSLRVEFKTRAGIARVIDNVSFKLERGKSLGLVGECCCG